tara:strand:- start:576 stop:782 length:207 start_codon:yes stop_codon:yes gene_type:complete
MRKKIKYGTKLLTKHGVLKVNHIDLCENEGDKYGISVEAVWLKDKDRCVFEFENSSNWQYGYQVHIVD